MLVVARNIEELASGLYAYNGEHLRLLEKLPVDSPRREEWFFASQVKPLHTFIFPIHNKFDSDSMISSPRYCTQT